MPTPLEELDARRIAPVHAWQDEGKRFTLLLWVWDYPDANKVRLAYRFWDTEYGPEYPVFEGWDFSTPQLYTVSEFAVDWENATRGLLNFLSLKNGDTDQEYFDSYTDEQRVWMETHAEDLQTVLLETWGG